MASVALLAIAPAAGVHAATAADGKSVTLDQQGVSGIYDSGKGAQANKNANTAVATESSSAVSDVWAHVTSGYLTLDAVPDLYFGTVTAGLPAGLYSNDTVRDNDGNQKGVLQVTDSRSLSGQQGLGYLLTAQLGAFHQYATKEAAETGTDSADNLAKGTWELDLKGGVKMNDTTGNPSDVALNNVDIIAGTNAAGQTAGQAGAAGQVIKATAGTGFGTVQHIYSDQKDATLHVPEEATEGYYVAPLTWTLKASADATVNDPAPTTPQP
ncbi:hypothetical protein IV56_GL000575 [Lacticaseibacillus saniviri JCM 17471 = DSM 24301]|uniref:WxL domain-containing protein n=1 Tax=Lacticaseibacillus saniviri JCM 17471 = DSM 24301 TaxID=1293598 RepID=A0A0R2MTY8_9LACO|nr:hypothetical protein IV56_GL000575 [Lacticaseibacillus saniviri JCM 17471 = DSM 24301]